MANYKGKPYIGSTEPQSRKILEEMRAANAASAKPVAMNTGNTTTARTPAGVTGPTPEQVAAQKAALRKKQEEKIRQEKLRQLRERTRSQNSQRPTGLRAGM